MAQLKDLIVNGPSRFIGDVYATTFTGDLNGNANTATSATTAAALTGKTLVTASALTTSNWPTYKDNHIPTMSFMTYWNGAYSGTSSNLTYCAQGAIIGSNNIGNQSVKYATTSGTCSGNSATATKATQDSDGNVIKDTYIKKDGNNGTAAGVSALINKLDAGSATPTDADYYVCQYAGGGTTTTTYHRRPMSSMWNWIKAKTDTLYPTKSGSGATGTWGISITGDAKYATTAGSAPASDVSSWAKQSTKPSYSFSEITSKPTTISGYGITDALTTSNYTSYTVKKDGTGASGTWGINISGNATTATKVGTSTVGSTTMPIYINSGTPTAITSFPEAYLSWGGKNFAGSYGPIDAAMISDLGACRSMFAKAAGITIQYSRNGGSTWVDYGCTDTQKTGLFSVGHGIVIGGTTETGIDKSKYKLRVIVTTDLARIYTTLNKIAIYVSASGSTGSNVTIDARTKANVDAGSDTWTTLANSVPVNGWSGWNIINIPDTTTFGNSSGQYQQIRFTFGVTSHASTVAYPGLSVSRIMMFGGVGWVVPSNMASNGHLYTFNASQNATFPGAVTSTMFVKSGGTSAQFLKADGSVDSNTYLTGITKQMVTNALGYTPPTTNTTYNFSGTSFTSGSNGVGEHDANNITTNGLWYYTSNGPATSLGASTADGALYSQAYSATWVGQIAQDYRNGNLFTRGKNNGTWSNWKAVSYVGHIHTGSEVKLTGYSKASSYLEISASDTVNQAIGKLEGAISGLENLLASI